MTIKKTILLMFVVIAALLIGYFMHGKGNETMTPGMETMGESPSNNQKKGSVLVWTCSMHPQIQLPKPGKCPICGMELIPVKGAEKGRDNTPRGLRELTLSPYAMKLAEIQTSPVERRPVSVHVRMVGKIEYDETRVGYITAWVPGRIDKLYVDFTGVSVHKGDPMAYLYSPQLMTAQSELLEAIKTANKFKASQFNKINATARQTIAAVREKLRLLGMTENQVTEIIKQGHPSDHVTVLSPLSGIVIHKDALEGMYLKTGSRIYTIADLSRVWIRLDAYESDIMWLRKGQEVEIQAEAFPGQTFIGTISFIDPFVNPQTRTIKVRVNVPNTDYKLKPEMFVHALVKVPISDVAMDLRTSDKTTGLPLVIPASAPLITGKRAVVYIAVPGKEGSFEGREIVLGPRAGNYYVVLSGLHEGEHVVTNGNFKIDSSLQIQAKPSMMSSEGKGGGGRMHHGGGMSMKKEKTGAKTSKKEIPAAFVYQVKKLIDAYRSIAENVQTGDMEGTRTSFRKLGIVLNSVNMNLLSGHPHMVWMELSMLIHNDSIIGENVKDMDEAKADLLILKGHLNRMKSQFNI